MEQPKEWNVPFAHGADTTLIPLTKAAIHQLAATLPRLRGSEHMLVWQLPFILFDRDIPLYTETLRTLHRAGFRRFEATNLSHFEMMRIFKELQVSTGQRCFSLNSQALLAWHDLGATTATLYIEDDADNLADLLKSDLPIERRVIMYAPLPVMTTKIRLKEVHGNTPLRSDRGEEYSVSTHDGLQTITAATPFSLTARHAELRRTGCGSFLIDLTEAPRERWGDIMAAFKTGRDVAGTTEFNYPKELI
jgi:putative protease